MLEGKSKIEKFEVVQTEKLMLGNAIFDDRLGNWVNEVTTKINTFLNTVNALNEKIDLLNRRISAIEEKERDKKILDDLLNFSDEEFV